jgi:hypothetical protein
MDGVYDATATAAHNLLLLFRGLQRVPRRRSCRCGHRAGADGGRRQPQAHRTTGSLQVLACWCRLPRHERVPVARHPDHGIVLASRKGMLALARTCSRLPCTGRQGVSRGSRGWFHASSPSSLQAPASSRRPDAVGTPLCPSFGHSHRKSAAPRTSANLYKDYEPDKSLVERRPCNKGIGPGGGCDAPPTPTARLWSSRHRHGRIGSELKIRR